MPETFRLRVRFVKRGRLSHLSHLETMRAHERAVRRAGLPFAVSQGFSPRMRIAFGPALPVGTGGLREYYDLWMLRYVAGPEVLRALGSASVPDLTAESCGYVSERERSLASALSIAHYEVGAEGGCCEDGKLGGFLKEVVAGGELAVVRKGKDKVFDLSDALPKEPEVRTTDGRTIVEVTVRMSERGSLRPEALVEAAFTRSGLGGSITSVMRTDLSIEEDGVVRRPL